MKPHKIGIDYNKKIYELATTDPRIHVWYI